MKRGRSISVSTGSGPLRSLACAGALLWCSAVAFAGGPETKYDPTGDAAFRPTSLEGMGLLPVDGPIDLISVKYGGWSTSTPTTDPYSGSWSSSSSAHLLRIDLKLGGLVCPPGPLVGTAMPNPTAFGARPLYGFIEFDVDHDRDTGGETTQAAGSRFLANVARFGNLPTSSISSRVALSLKDVDLDWTTDPAIERSGADWVLTFCGCFTPTVIFESVDANGLFDPGETMIVRGRFFQRAGGYRASSLVLGGTTPGAYDPFVDLRFRHSVSENTTTVSLVYAIDMAGAASLTGQPQQPINTSVADHTSIAEGVQDLITRSSTPLFGLAWALIHEWEDKQISDATKVEDWRATALVGTAYSQSCDSVYLWTDVGFDLDPGDVNGDGWVNSSDSSAIAAFIAAHDGGPDDADGQVNGQFQIGLFPFDFSLYDLNADGVVGTADMPVPPCPADFDGSGTVSVNDLFEFLAAWFAQNGGAPGMPNADFDASGTVSVNDLFAFLSAWFAGC